MAVSESISSLSGVTHSWWHKIRVAYVPGYSSTLLDRFIDRLMQQFKIDGHFVVDKPADDVDVIVTTVQYGKPLNWRDALFFNARRRFQLRKSPLVFTIIHMTPEEYQVQIEYLKSVLSKDNPIPADFNFPGLTSRAFHTLYEQGRRGGPILSLVRLLQSQSLSIRIILVIGHEAPIEAYTFDLVGAHPRTIAANNNAFYDDLVARITTAASTHEVTAHQVLDEIIPYQLWKSLTTPAAMYQACREFGSREFFTEMVRVDNLVSIPTLNSAMASQYSEGCYATWDPVINGLVTTITGSARPVDKGNLTENELAVIVGLKPDKTGAIVRHVDGKRNDSPSSEAVEMMEIDSILPKVDLKGAFGLDADLPVIRSKLHGHRGIAYYDPKKVERVTLDPAYHRFPVSCSTKAQADGIKAAFSKSVALNNPKDPRKLVFVVLPGHGVVIVEKWEPGKEPFQLIWESFDNDSIKIDNLIPQGPFTYELNANGKMGFKDD